MFKCKKFIIIISIFILSLAFSNNGYSADESVLFTSVPPDALIVLDLSGSMNWNPAGTNRIWGSTLSCTPNANCSGTGCSGGYCNASKTGCNVNCSRLAIAKRAIFEMLDDNNDNQITSTGTNSDDLSLNIRVGYMRFYDGNDTAGDYNSGNIRIPSVDGIFLGIGTPYSRLFCNNASSCSNPGINPSTSSHGQPIATTRANSGTPLSSSLIEARSYLDFHKASDPARECRDKFVILISDGADTYICGGTGTEDASDMYKRRRETVARAKALGDAGYKVFVIGFGGDMPECLKRTLNWAAYYGMTDNPAALNSGSVTAYNVPIGSLFPAGVSSCQTDSPVPTTIINNICGKGGGLGDTVASANDPATADLSGYAFITGSSEELTTALKQVMNIIRSARYSFTIASVATARLSAQNHLYEASFTPVEDEPFWLGRLKKYNILTSGAIGGQEWDAGDVLFGMSAGSRNIKTCLSGTALIDFTTANILPLNLGLASGNTLRRDEIVGYIRGEPAFNQDYWKLGDIWHSSPIFIGSPNPYFRDGRDVNNAFSNFWENNMNRTSIVSTGANDGQFHVFTASVGQENFSFIPPSMLPKLQLIAHKDHPTSLTHQFFVDGPISAADVWLGSGTGESKSASEWKTMVVIGLGRGVGPNSKYLWSASSNCTPTTSTDPYGYSPTYSATTNNYCGYYAFDFTNTTAPVYKWRINPTAAQSPYLGDPWSKMAIGRVIINGNEKWVGFIGGGGCDYDCSNRVCTGNKGRGFFVIDLSDGNVLWSYTGTTASIPAPPSILDLDYDGFIDTAYVGDLGGNIWRFTFCDRNNKNLGNPCTSQADWRGSRLFSGGGQPIYTSVATTLDKVGNLWVLWGTGDKQCPALTTGANGAFYALKDNDRTTTHSSIGSNGWSISLPEGGEKILAEPAVFGGEVFFTSYVPWTTGGDPCRRGGKGKLYRANFPSGVQTEGPYDLGIGIPSAPLISINPEKTRADLYITMSGGGGEDSRTFEIKQRVPGFSPINFDPNMSNILFWRDRRIQ